MCLFLNNGNQTRVLQKLINGKFYELNSSPSVDVIFK